jgi:hypothetical protein
MRVGAIVCFIIAAIAVPVAVMNVVSGSNRPERVEDFAGYAVGSFLVPIALLVVGLILWGKANKNK